jgi:hypothetical protein
MHARSGESSLSGGTVCAHHAIRVNHTAIRCRGDIHTNSMENVWSLLKRSIIGSYHQVSTKHLDAYLDEMEFRFNNRENPYMFRDAMLKLLLAETLPYAKLIADS